MKKTIIPAILILALGACGKSPSAAPDKPIRHCVDKDKKVVDESLCEAPTASSSGLGWLYLYMLMRPGQTVAGGSHTLPVGAHGFTSYRSAVAQAATPRPAPAATSRAIEPPRSSAPMKFSSPSTSIPRSSAPVKSYSSPRPSYRPSYSSPSRSFSSPSRSSARYR